MHAHWRDMVLSRGTVIGSCEILDLLGEGGMGKVYRGRDTRLGRDVAVKALPEAFVHDADRVARFGREAQLLAALNHPNIAAIYDVAELGGLKYLVLELVEGETLAERLDRGPLPLEDTCDVAVQIAEALAAAHGKNIIHRDLKPANIKITPDGRIKVLDFGLAKVQEGVSSSGVLVSNSPTLSAIQSAAGVIMGTAAYMSPEQARGRPVDKRTDIWAFGCVVFEMLTGQLVFPNGETVSDTLAGILAREPDWNLLPASTPPKLRALLQRCLRKDVRQRLQDIGDARIELEEARREPAAAATQPSEFWRRRETVLAFAALLLLLTTLTMAFLLYRQQPESGLPVVVKFEVPPPGSTTFRANNAPLTANAPFPELSPDGRKLVFVASTEQRQVLWIRSMDAPVPTALTGTEDGIGPFWSPDSKYIAFFTATRLNKIPAVGGPVQVLCDFKLSEVRGGTWSTEDAILLGKGDAPLQRISSAGGQPVPESEFDPARSETAHILPHFLPDGRHYTFVAVGPQTATFIGTLGSKERKPLANIRSEAMYVPPGYLLFIRNGALMSQRFDLSRLELSGDAFPVATVTYSAVTGPFSASDTGAIAFRPFIGLSNISPHAQLVWMDPKGKPLGVAGPEGEYGNIDLSPDARYVAFERGDPPDVWVLDVDKGIYNRITSDGKSGFPIWLRDGRTVAFSTSRDGPYNIYQHTFGGVGPDEPVVKDGRFKSPIGWSKDGAYFAYTACCQPAFDLWMIAKGASAPQRLTQTPSNKVYHALSPDSHWISYGSDETGRYEVYVQSFPTSEVRQQVSTSGGIMPKWSADGRRLFYVSPDSWMMSVSVKPIGASLEISAPSRLFQVQIAGRGVYVGGQSHNYSVAADGRFLIKVTAVDSTSTPITVITNWAAGLGK
jgi:eukaryotic-like serine/threonine-protein kinase